LLNRVLFVWWGNLKLIIVIRLPRWVTFAFSSGLAYDQEQQQQQSEQEEQGGYCDPAPEGNARPQAGQLVHSQWGFAVVRFFCDKWVLKQLVRDSAGQDVPAIGRAGRACGQQNDSVVGCD